MVSPPKSSSASNTNTTVKEVFRDLPKVCTTEILVTVTNFLPIFFNKFSLILSKTTIVSCTENPIIVRRAVTKSVSISTPKNFPKIAKIPTTSKTS